MDSIVTKSGFGSDHKFPQSPKHNSFVALVFLLEQPIGFSSLSFVGVPSHVAWFESLEDATNNDSCDGWIQLDSSDEPLNVLASVRSRLRSVAIPRYCIVNDLLFLV